MTTASHRKLLSACSCCGPALSRRDFIASGTAALGLAATGLATTGLAQAEPARKPRIDVHHHVVPPMQKPKLGGNGATDKWTVARSLDDMDKAGVTTAITSIINPGTWFGNVEEGRKLTRECNDWCKQLETDHPGRFRTFAAIPLPDTEGSLRAIEYALDTLKVEGIALWTMYDGKYLGDPAFLPVFEELNRRKAVCYTHPTVPTCCASLVPGVSVSTLEYNHDTTRTIASLVFGKGKTALKFPDIKFIWSHAGGTLPFLTSRFEILAKARKAEFPDGAVGAFKKFYYEVAQGNTPAMLDGLMRMVPISQVMFGSDYPYREAKEALDGVTNYDKFSDADRQAIYYENAQRVMPGLKSV